MTMKQTAGPTKAGKMGQSMMRRAIAVPEDASDGEISDAVEEVLERTLGLPIKMRAEGRGNISQGDRGEEAKAEKRAEDAASIISRHRCPILVKRALRGKPILV